MSRGTHQALSVVGTIVVFSVFSVLLYYFGGYVEKFFIGNKMDINRWHELYRLCVVITGATTGLLTLGWILYAAFGKRINDPNNVDARMIWMIFGGLTIVMAAVVPNVYAMAKSIPLHVSVSLCMVIAYGLCYYACTLYGTPKKFKYTPLGAEALMAEKNA